MPTRRQLQFRSWDEVRADLDSLLAGYDQAGNWDLGQACKHLNDWLRFPMDGFPETPWPIRAMFFFVRYLFGKFLLRKILRAGKMTDGVPTSPETVYERTPGQVERDAVNELKCTIDRFELFHGEIHPSPVFGKMDRQTAEQLQWVHFAHHLGHLCPLGTPASS